VDYDGRDILDLGEGQPSTGPDPLDIDPQGESPSPVPSDAGSESTTAPANGTDMSLSDLLTILQEYPTVDPDTGLILGPIETMPDQVLENVAKENQAALEAGLLILFARKPSGTWKEVLDGLNNGKGPNGQRLYDIYQKAYSIPHKYIWMYSTKIEHEYEVKCCYFSDRRCDENDETVKVRVWGELLVGLYQFKKTRVTAVSSFELLDESTDRTCCVSLSGAEAHFNSGRSSNRGHEVSLKVDRCQCGSYGYCDTWISCHHELAGESSVLIRKAERYVRSKFTGENANKQHIFQVKLGQYVLDRDGAIDLQGNILEIFIEGAAGEGGAVNKGICPSI
jgi:hypothetical protein